MENTYKQFVDILSAGIRGNTVNNIYENVDFDKVIELAKSHKVEGIIYTTLKRNSLLNNIDSNVVKQLNFSTFRTAIGQSNNIKNLSEIFKEFNKKEIPVIVLKGLVVRNFFKQPDLRTMSDADILVKKEDVERTKELLISLGYRELEDHHASHHTALVHHKYPMIEVHWNLFKRDGFSKSLEDYEKLIWNDAINVNVGEAEVLSLGYEDLALHLCMHMAAHLAATGFGVRQICDLVLLVEKKGNEIDWNKFIKKSREYGFEKFNLIMFILCRDLFNMEIPKELDVSKIDNKIYIASLINEIFESGVHGKKDMTSRFGNQVAFNFGEKDNNATLGAFKRYFRFIFPPINKMSDKYSYAKKCKVLAPIAWIHHLICGVFSSHYSLKDKLIFMTKGANVAVKRNKLLNWLEL